MKLDVPPVHEAVRDKVAGLLASRSGPVLVHSDLFGSAGGVATSRSREGILRAHLDLLMSAAGTRDLWMPTFNYDFLSTGRFNVEIDPVQVGPLPEYFRTTRAEWRTLVPVFSVAGTGRQPTVSSGGTLDPFGSDSIFAQIADRKGSILFYGAGLHSCTFIHHVERFCGGPAYRYDKVFQGVTSTASSSQHVKLNYHVRPRGHHLDYDWGRLLRDLERSGRMRRVIATRFCALAVEADDLRAFWTDRIATDPLYLLDDASRRWVGEKLNQLGRPFEFADFES